MGELRQQEVRADRTGDETDQRARPDALQASRFDGRLRPDAQHLVADLGQQILLAGLVQGLVEGPLLGLSLRLLGLLLGAYGRLAGVAVGGLLDARLLGLAGRLQDGLALALGTLTSELAQRRPGGAGERDRLQQRQTVRDGVRAEDSHGGRDGALGARPEAERREQLGDVHAEHEVARGDLAAAQIRENHGAGTIHQNRVASQPAMRDPP